MSRYRKYIVEVHIDIHDSIPETEDPLMLTSLANEITEQATGDVIIINTRRPKRA